MDSQIVERVNLLVRQTVYTNKQFKKSQKSDKNF
jgi:hypothetical protein